MRKAHYLSTLVAAQLLAGFAHAFSRVTAHTISRRGPAQSGEAAKQKPDGALDPAFDDARRLSKQGKFDEAIRQLEVLARNQPDLKGVAHELGVAYYKKADYLKAVESFKKALEENPGDNEAVQLMGISYYLAGRPGEAIAPLEKVQTWYPSANVDAAYILGVCYIQTKDYPNARKAFAKMFAVAADSAAAYLFAARMLLRQDFGPVAEEYAKKAVDLDPKLPLAHSLLGELYLYKSRLPEAIEQFQKELELNPGEAAVYYRLADAYSRLQKYEEAERLLQRSIWLDPNNPMPHHLLGQTYREMGRTEEAERELKLSEQLQIHQDAKP